MLDPDRHEKITKLFLEARQVEVEKRGAFLESACGSDVNLRAEVESLLSHDEMVAGFLSTPVDAEGPTASIDAAAETESTKSLKLDGNLRAGVPASEETISSPVPGYRIIREIGSGAMGRVFEAHHEKLNRRVALKVLSRHLAASKTERRRFEHEAWIAGRLNHPNIVQVHDRGVTADVSYFTMELVDGGSLHDLLGNLRAWGKDDRWGLCYQSRDYIAWAVGVIRDAAVAIDYAHNNDVYHRDIKPRNLLIDRERGDIKIADFGLAIHKDLTRLTASDQAVGTVSYMAPEQFRGEEGRADHRADIYALGVTLFQLVTLRLPFSGTTIEQYVKSVLTDEASRPRALNELVGRDLEVVIKKALEKDPIDRYQSAREFAEDLANVLQYRPIQAKPPSVPARVWKWARRKPLHASFAAVLILGTPISTFLAIRAIQHSLIVRALEVEDLLQEVRWLSRDERYEELIVKVTRVLNIDPNNVDALRARGISYLNLAKREGNPVEFRELQEKCLEDLDRVIELQPTQKWPYRLKAHALREFDRPDAAAQIQQVTDRFVGEETGDDELYFDAQLAYERADYPSAIDLLDQLCVRRPNWAEAFQSRGFAHEENGRRDLGIGDLRVALALSPGDTFYRYELGRLLTEDESWAEGEEHLRIVQEREPELAEACEAMAQNFMGQGRNAQATGEEELARELFRRAERESRRALELRSDSLWAYINLGSSLAEQYRLDPASETALLAEAIESYEYVLSVAQEVRPGSEAPAVPERIRRTAVFNLCDALIQASRLQRALDVCSQTIELTPDDPDAYYNLAGVLAMSDQPDDAFWALEQDFQLGDRDWAYLSEDRWFESLREDSRFAALIDRMKNGE